MTHARLRKTAAAMAVALGMMLAIVPTTAEAVHGDRYAVAKHKLLGHQIVNHHTHLHVWMVGFWDYQRRIKVHGHLRKHTFHGLRVSAQRCNPHKCWGRTIRGRLSPPPRYQPGRPLKNSRGGQPAHDFCMPNTPVCAAPWNWYAKYVDKRQETIEKQYVGGCVGGALTGFGGVAATNLAARQLFDTGVITSAQRGTAMMGPRPAAVVALAGCYTGMAAAGVYDIRQLFK